MERRWQSFWGDRMGDTFRHELAYLAYQHLGEVPSGSVINDVVRVLAAEGRARDPEPVLLRVGNGASRDLIVYDLGRADYAAVRIEPGDWAVVGQLGGAVFRRTAVTKPQVMLDGDAPPLGLNRLADVLNLTPDRSIVTGQAGI